MRRRQLRCYWPSSTKAGHERLWPARFLTKTASLRGSPHAAETVPSAWHGSQPDASPDPHGNAHYKTPQTHLLREASGAARPSPKGPPETSLKPGPSLRSPWYVHLRDIRHIASRARPRTPAGSPPSPQTGAPQPPQHLKKVPARAAPPRRAPGSRKARAAYDARRDAPVDRGGRPAARERAPAPEAQLRARRPAEEGTHKARGLFGAAAPARESWGEVRR